MEYLEKILKKTKYQSMSVFLDCRKLNKRISSILDDYDCLADSPRYRYSHGHILRNEHKEFLVGFTLSYLLGLKYARHNIRHILQGEQPIRFLEKTYGGVRLEASTKLVDGTDWNISVSFKTRDAFFNTYSNFTEVVCQFPQDKDFEALCELSPAFNGASRFSDFVDFVGLNYEGASFPFNRLVNRLGKDLLERFYLFDFDDILRWHKYGAGDVSVNTNTMVPEQNIQWNIVSQVGFTDPNTRVPHSAFIPSEHEDFLLTRHCGLNLIDEDPQGFQDNVFGFASRNKYGIYTITVVPLHSSSGKGGYLGEIPIVSYTNIDPSTLDVRNGFTMEQWEVIKKGLNDYANGRVVDFDPEDFKG